jgi:tetratricopeptide (TPR) repeat protein
VQSRVSVARASRQAGDLEGAAQTLRDALDCWDTEFEDDTAAQFSDLDRQRLVDLRLAILEEWALAALALGSDGPEIINLLAAASLHHPLRERLAELLMWALYRHGRQEEAVACFERIRRELRKELGQDPGEPLRQMQLRVLRHDPSLAPTSRKSAQIHNVPPRNTQFVGRESELQDVDALLSGASARVAVWGLVGVGKSALTLECVHRARDRFDCVWWIDASTRASTLADLERLAARLGCALPADREPNLFLLWSALHRVSRTLLVYDNASGADQIAEFLPPDGCKVLISSLNPDWWRFARSVKLDVLSCADSIALLRQSIGPSDTDVERRIVEQVGRLPLAMVQAAAYISQTGMSADEYLPLLSRRRAQLLERGVPDDHRGTIAATWRLALAELSTTHPAAVQLLAMCCLLAPANIPLDLVRAAPQQLPPELRAAVEDELGLEDAIAQARRYSLVAREGDLLQVHCLVQEVIASSLPAEDRERWHRRAAAALVALAPADETARATWPRWELLAPHVREVATACTVGGTASDQFVELMQRTSRYFGTRAAFVEALELMQAAQDLIEGRAAAWGDVPVGRGMTELAEALEQAGSLKDALSAYERALALLRQHAGPEDPWVARALSGLGSVLTCHSGVTLWKPDELDEAERRFVEALRILEAALGPESPVVARTVAGLGQVRQDRGDLSGAVQCQQRALSVLVDAYGPEHPDVGHSYDKLGYALALTGDTDRSRDCFDTARGILEKAYGPGDPSVGWSLSNLAMLLLSSGELEEALSCQTKADSIFAKQEPEGSSRQISIWRLAQIHVARGDRRAAAAMLEPALALTRTLLGPDHGDVRGMERDLAAALDPDVPV